MSWRRLKNALKTNHQDEYIHVDQGVLKLFSENMTKANIRFYQEILKTKMKDVFKASSERYHQDEC